MITVDLGHVPSLGFSTTSVDFVCVYYILAGGLNCRGVAALKNWMISTKDCP